MASGFKLDAASMLSALETAPPKLDAAIGMYAKTAAQQLQNTAQQDAPWTDRTAHARQRLKGEAQRVGEGYLISLAHGVDYGIYLELCNEKKYAVIEPTIKKMAPEILQAFQGLLSKIG